MKTKSRKQARKEFRKAKKLKKHEFFSKKKPKNKQSGEHFQKKITRQNENKEKKGVKTNEIEKIAHKIEKSVNYEKKKKEFKNPHEEMDFTREKDRKQKQKLDKEIRDQRIKQLKRDNLKEDMEIRKLEKQLKMKKGKSKAFAFDGLDYLLDICDKSGSGTGFETLEGSDSEFESDLENVMESSRPKDALKKKKRKKEVKTAKISDKEDDKALDDDDEDNEAMSHMDDDDDDDDEALDNEDDEALDNDDDDDEALDDEDDEALDNEDDEALDDDDDEAVDDDDDDDEAVDDEEEGDEDDEAMDFIDDEAIEDNGEALDEEDDDAMDFIDDETIEDDDEVDEAKDYIDDEAIEDDEAKDYIDDKAIEDDEALDEEELEEEEEEEEEFSNLKSDISSDSGDESQNKVPITEIKRKTKQSDDKLRTKKKKVTFNEKNTESDFSDEEIIDAEGKKNSEMSKMWEDIYGRTRDEKGNIVNTYTPPQLRRKADGETTNEKLVRLKKQLKGLLNRLAESNMAFISNQIEQLYMSNSRNDMNETLCNLFNDSIVSEALTPERLITEHAMLIAVLHANIGSEIGAHFLQYAVMEFCKMLESDPDVEDKRINNILIFILHLYNFQIFHSKLMYDIINELLKRLEEKQIELLLTTLRTVGFSLRKDDPAALKSLVLKVQERANTITSSEISSRVKFMLEMLMAIKNNNMSKIPNYNPEFVEKLRKNLKVLVRKGNYSSELNISLQDLLNAEKHGRWWIVGSAWSGSAPTHPDASKPKTQEVPSTEFSQRLLELARKQRMNTDVRRNIFCILMSAEDFLEAFEKLLKLKLKGAVEREIMNVLVHCALQEKNFNPYYVFLANKFCTFDRKYQMMLQCAIWDKIKELKNALPVQVTNLAKFVGNVILERGLPISILKVIQFSELDKPTMKFMRQVLLTIFIHEDRNAVAAVFKRIADSPKLKLFRESLRLFLQHFVLKKTAKNVEEEKVSRLAEMVKLAEEALTSSDVSMVF